jgi:hypothetical protein
MPVDGAQQPPRGHEGLGLRHKVFHALRSVRQRLSAWRVPHHREAMLDEVVIGTLRLNMARTSWLIVIFGEPELDRALQRAAISPAPETEWFSSPYGRGKSAPHAHRRHARREPIVSSSPSPVARSS